jgi:sarcosine oxidase subunit alpha
MTSKRLAPPFGQRLDRSQSLSFEFNGRRLSGHPGDTLASALLANGVRLIGRSSVAAQYPSLKARAVAPVI